MSNDITWLDIMQGLSTPLIALAVAVIAFQQLCINRNRLKLELFEVRYPVYEATKQFIKSVHVVNQNLYEDVNDYQKTILDAEFLFDKEMALFLGDLHALGLKICHFHRKADMSSDQAERAGWVEKEMAAQQELWGRYETMVSRFRKFLKLSH